METRRARNEWEKSGLCQEVVHQPTYTHLVLAFDGSLAVGGTAD